MKLLLLFCCIAIQCSPWTHETHMKHALDVLSAAWCGFLIAEELRERWWK